MKTLETTLLLTCAALLAAPPMLLAQHEEMPDPKLPEHAALAALAGTWDVTMKMEAMPGVKGMEKATESVGTERADLVCNGLWLKTVTEAVCDGVPFQGLWLSGYDPFAKQYTGYWVSSDPAEGSLLKMAGSYDEKTRTWSWSGTTPHGEMRSSYAWQDKDTTVETCFMKAPDGKEAKCMEITRKRTKAANTADASVKVPAVLPATKLPAEIAVLHRDLGQWDAIVKSGAPGQTASEDRATETVAAICHGRWTWSDFKGQIMGQPFEGHALCGYDPAAKQHVSVWIDTMSAVAMQTSGTFDQEHKVGTFTGSALDPMGNPVTVKEVLTRTGADARVLKMAFTSAGQTSNMEITYLRKAQR